MGDFISDRLRSRCYSMGTMPLPHGPKVVESKRIRARLEASSVGLGELLLLKQNQHRAIESVKAMFMSNLPLDDRMEQEKIFKISLNIPSVIVETCPDNSSLTDEKDKRLERSSVDESRLEDSGFGEELQSLGEHSHRKRSVSMDVSVARSLALSAKVGNIQHVIYLY